MKEQIERLREAVAAQERSRRLDALNALTLLRCGDRVEGEAVHVFARTLLNSYPRRDPQERAAITRFFEAWFVADRSWEISRRLLAARMEEIQPALRESLLASAISAMPNEDLIRLLDDPPEEFRTAGLGLLMAVEAVAFRVRDRAFTAGDLESLIPVLRRCRSLRASHVARPFLWRVEDVLSSVRALVSKFRI